MRRSHFTSLVVLPLVVAAAVLSSAPLRGQTRIAILPLKGEPTAVSQLIVLAERSGYSVIDDSQITPALTGAKYDGSLNMSVEDARGLGLSIGCDYFITGLARIQRRLISEKESYFDVFAALFAVETRSGKLAGFAFANSRCATEKEGTATLRELLERIWPLSANAIESASGKHEDFQQAEVYDLDSKESQRLGIKPPQFFRRIKPQMTESADLAGISATVELKVEFRSDGRIGQIEPTKWGGFGLDEAAVAAVRQLRFEPASMDGKPVSVSAMVRYNFRKEEKSK